MDRNTKIRCWALVPIGLALIFTYLFSTELPVDDYWGFLYECYMLRDAGLKEHLVYYWQPANDHILIFPKITIDLLSRLTDNQHYSLELALGFAARLVLLYLFWLLIRAADLSEYHSTLAWLASALLIFWPIHQPVFVLHIDSTGFAWCLTFGILALYLLQRFWGRWLGIISGALACVVSSYSHGSGMPLGIAIGIILLPQSGWSKKQKAVWWLIALTIFSLFAISLPTRDKLGFPPLIESLKSPFKLVTFFFKCLTPPFSFFNYLESIRWPHIQTAVGIILAALYLAPLLQLFKQKRLFTRIAFPWFALITWVIGIAGAAAIGRCTSETIPRQTYFMSQVLGLIGAVPLWLLAYPDIWPQTKKEWISRHGLITVILLVPVIFLYGYGSVKSVFQSQRRYQLVKWSQSCLSYYPALDRHVLYLCPPSYLDRFRNEILPQLVQRHVIAKYADYTPFTIPVATTFRIKNVNDLEVIATDPDRFQFLVKGKNPYVTFTVLPSIYKRHIVAFTTETSAAADVEFAWNDGSSGSHEKAIVLERNGWLRTENRGYFPELCSADQYLAVTEIRFRLTNFTASEMFIVLQHLQVLTR